MSRRLKVMLTFGTRPEAIKMAPLYHALRQCDGSMDTQLCVTAQHRQMLDQVLTTFDLCPDIDLNLMRAGQDLADVTSAVLTGMRDVLKANRPDMILVHGDTTTALAAAMAGFYAGVPVGHVEAGLRTHDIHAPFPEEFNRQTVGKIARWHFCPTATSRENLLREGVRPESVTVTGNTVIDALHWILGRIRSEPGRAERVAKVLNGCLPFPWRQKRFVLITGHRRENFGEGFVNICEALKVSARRHPEVHFVYPVHLNPNVQGPVRSVLENLPNVHLIEPMEYEPFVVLLQHCYFVLTDSGGIQEEAPSLGKPVLVMREVTERPEAVDAGTVRLVGARAETIISSLNELIDDEARYTSMARAHNPYGDGKACERILETLGTL